MPVLTGGQVLDCEAGQSMANEWGGQLLEGGQQNLGDHGLIEEAEEPVMGMGPYKYSGAPADGYKNGIAEKGAYLVDILTGDTYRNTGTKAATAWEVEAPSGGGSGVQVATVLITANELKALHTTPKQLIAAPGVGKFLLALRTLFDFTPGVVPYTNPNGSSFYAIYGAPPDTGTNRATYYDAAILTNAGRTISPEPVTTADYDASAVLNMAINLTLDQAVLDGDGTLAVTTVYLVI